MLSGRWHDSHFAWKIGATSFVNVGAAFSAATAEPDRHNSAVAAVRALPPTARHILNCITRLLFSSKCWKVWELPRDSLTKGPGKAKCTFVFHPPWRHRRRRAGEHTKTARNHENRRDSVGERRALRHSRHV